MAKKLSELFKPRAAGERAFFDKHKVRETPDPYGNGEDVRNGGATKTFDRKRFHYGYNPGQDVTAYDRENSKGSSVKKTVMVPATAVGNWGARDGYSDNDYAEDVEVDELSKVTLSKYVMRAGHQALDDDHPKNEKRRQSVSKALDKINKEETELDELSKTKLRAYKKAAGAGLAAKAKHVNDKGFVKRLKGIDAADKRINKMGPEKDTKEAVELEEIVTSRNKTNGFHGHIAGTMQEKQKLFHNFHRWVATATGVKMTEDPDVIRNFLDSAHGRFIAQRINANQPKEDIHHHALARWKAFKTTYSPHHFKTVGEDFSEAWDMPTPHNSIAGPGGAPTVAVKPDRRMAKWAAGDEIRRAARYHNDQAGEYSARASEHRHHAEMSKKAKKHALSGHHWALDGVMRKAARIHDSIAKHYQNKVGKHH